MRRRRRRVEGAIEAGSTFLLDPILDVVVCAVAEDGAAGAEAANHTGNDAKDGNDGEDGDEWADGGVGGVKGRGGLELVDGGGHVKGGGRERGFWNLGLERQIV